MPADSATSHRKLVALHVDFTDAPYIWLKSEGSGAVGMDFAAALNR